MKGLAIVGVDDSNGTWQYTLNGTNWFDIGSVSASNALLLPSDTVPLPLRAQRQLERHHRPVPVQGLGPDQRHRRHLCRRERQRRHDGLLRHLGIDLRGHRGQRRAGRLGSATLAAIDEDTASPPGATVSALFGANFSDATDQSRVVRRPTPSRASRSAATRWMRPRATGSYSTNSGGSWTTLGSATTTTAITLDAAASTMLRFVPAANYNGAATALSVNLIESGLAITNGATINLTGATGGTTPISAATVVLGHTITAVNDPPTITSDGGGATAAVSVAENARRSRPSPPPTSICLPRR